MSAAPPLPPETRWLPLVERALEEDLGPGDISGEVTIPESARCTARIEAREPLVVAGLPVAAAVFHRIDPDLEFTSHAEEARCVDAGDRLVSLRGSTRSILAAERTALNFLGRLSGVATWTRRFVDAVQGTRAEIVDTRKTIPGWRTLDKYAVAAGGGVNHRMGLYDGILLKDNHLAALGGVEPAVKSALAQAPPHLRVQVEVQSLEEAEAAVAAGADFLLLDNCSPDQIERIVQHLGDRALLEASGGIHLDNVRAYATTGVQRISVGALTHSAPNADVALEMDRGSNFDADRTAGGGEAE